MLVKRIDFDKAALVGAYVFAGKGSFVSGGGTGVFAFKLANDADMGEDLTTVTELSDKMLDGASER